MVLKMTMMMMTDFDLYSLHLQRRHWHWRSPTQKHLHEHCFHLFVHFHHHLLFFHRPLLMKDTNIKLTKRCFCWMILSLSAIPFPYLPLLCYLHHLPNHHHHLLHLFLLLHHSASTQAALAWIMIVLTRWLLKVFFKICEFTYSLHIGSSHTLSKLDCPWHIK